MVALTVHPDKCTCDHPDTTYWLASCTIGEADTPGPGIDDPDATASEEDDDVAWMAPTLAPPPGPAKGHDPDSVVLPHSAAPQARGGMPSRRPPYSSSSGSSSGTHGGTRTPPLGTAPGPWSGPGRGHRDRVCHSQRDINRPFQKVLDNHHADVVLAQDVKTSGFTTEELKDWARRHGWKALVADAEYRQFTDAHSAGVAIFARDSLGLGWPPACGPTTKDGRVVIGMLECPSLPRIW